MSYRILLNETRKEAWLDVNDEMDEEEDYRIIHITRPLQRILKEVPHWSFNDNIILYTTDIISYSTLDGYKELNFITYNKEAYLTLTQTS